jgi:hypothetical protein
VDDSRDSLNTNDPTSARQQSVAEIPVEALRVLAREIVEQAGLKRDPEIEGLRQNMRDTGDTFKHLSTLSGAAAAGVVVIVQTLGVEGALAVILHRAFGLGALGLSVEDSIAAVALGFIGIAFLLALLGLLGTTLWLTRANAQAVRAYPVKVSRLLMLMLSP